jgi:hypothetical protein
MGAVATSPGLPPAATAPAARTMNMMAVISFASGLGAWLVLPFVGAMIAVVTGHIARREIRETGQDGDTFAVIGLVLGYVHLAVVGLIVLAVIAFVVLALVLGVSSTRTAG